MITHLNADARIFEPPQKIDLVLTDPPFGIAGADLDKHYARSGSVASGYIDVPAQAYQDFANDWVSRWSRYLRDGGAFVVIVGHSALYPTLRALHEKTILVERNHLVWKFNFGVYTKRKFVTSHYHILYWVKPGRELVFQTNCRYGPEERDKLGHSLLYQDLEDVFVIKKEYKTNQSERHVNALPRELCAKLIQYLSKPGDLVADPFTGSGVIPRCADALGRDALALELSQEIYQRFHSEICGDNSSYYTPRTPELSGRERQGAPWTTKEIASMADRYLDLRSLGHSKTSAISVLCTELKRGRFAIQNKLKDLGL